MTRVFNDVVIGGVYLAPIVLYAMAALVAFLVLRPALYRAGFGKWFSSVAVAELSLFILIFGLFTLFS
jgi:hypothetical protein